MENRAVGQIIVRLMMVGDHDLHSQIPRQGDLVNRGDTAIDRDHQRSAPGGDFPNRFGIQAVAFTDPVRDEPVAFATQPAECADQDRCGADAVAVEVTVDRDALARADRRERRLHRDRHALEGEGIVALSRREECLGLGGRGNSATGKYRRDRATQPGGAFKVERVLDRVGLGPETN